jgi:NodT family efflux transporter outer membrane factor (OMF) lipoprotein
MKQYHPSASWPARPARLLAATLCGLLAGACSVGPDYHRPSEPMPAGFKEAEGWTPAQPADAIDRGAWWSVYKDPLLDDLEKQVDVSNQTLKSAEAAFRQARAVVEEARAAYFPTVAVSGSGQRSKAASGVGGGATNAYALTLGATWEPDIWGEVRRTVESDVASAQASAGAVASARLSAQATLATDYLELRAEDQLTRLLQDAVKAYERSLQITKNQYVVGVAAETDVLAAQTLLDGTQVQLINVGVERTQLEHAIAVLVGKAPADFSIAPAPLATEVPVVPTDLPSTLLQRRPDIASAERQMAAANAQIGVAVAAYYPNVALSGSIGFADMALNTLLRASNLVWSYAGSVSETVFDGGLRGAEVDAARAGYDGTVANYRQTVLTGLQQVEDDLAALRILEQQAGLADKTVAEAKQTAQLTLNQYQAGTVAYSSVITAQVAAITAEQTALSIQESRLTSSVSLIEALGGGWDETQLPDAKHL